MAFNQLTDAQAERLHILVEELGEAIQAAGKILRHGYESGWNGSNNRHDLEKELGHVESSIDRLVDAKELDAENIFASAYSKKTSIKPFLHHQHED